MAKKAKADTEKPNMSEAVRLGWKALGKDAPGTQVASWVKEKYGYDAPSSTISTNKVKVFGGSDSGGKKRGRKQRIPEFRHPSDSIDEAIRPATPTSDVSDASRMIGNLLVSGRITLQDIVTSLHRE